MKGALSLLCGVGFLVLTSCAHVRQQFAAYEGPQSIMRGEGGTKVVYDGVDLWTTGTPPRSYQVVGVLTDTRRDQRFSAASFGSDVATEVRKVGGTAIILVSESSQFLGTVTTTQATASTRATASSLGNSTTGYGTGNLFGTSDTAVISDKTTRLLVTKYLD